MLVDHDPGDTWSDLLVPENPIKEAHDCGDGVSFETYSRQGDGVKRGHPDYILSGGDLMEFDRCPHRWVMGYRDDATNATEWGSLIDCLLMDSDSLEERFALVPDTYKSEKGEEKPWSFNATVCKEWRKQQGGKQEVKSAELERAREAVQHILDDEQLAAVFRDSRRQVMLTGFYDDSETGVRVPLRCLIDLVPPGQYIADLKTCNCAHPAAWRKHVHQFGYHVQAARHLDLWNAAHNDTRRDFRHIIQESFKPYEVAKRFLSAEYLSLGRDRYVRALKRYSKCIKTGEWPGYDDPGPHDMVVDGFLATSPESWMVGV